MSLLLVAAGLGWLVGCLVGGLALSPRSVSTEDVPAVLGALGAVSVGYGLLVVPRETALVVLLVGAHGLAWGVYRYERLTADRSLVEVLGRRSS